MTVREDLTQAARRYLYELTDATSTQVLKSGVKYPKPGNPYATVRVVTPGLGKAIGHAEQLEGVSGGGAPVVAMRQRYEARVTYKFFGSSAIEWATVLELMLDSPEARLLMLSTGVAPFDVPSGIDVSAILDTQEEPRYDMDVLFRYRLQSTATDQIEILTASVARTFERYAADPDKLSADFVYTNAP